MPAASDAQRSAFNLAASKLSDAYYAAFGGSLAWMAKAAAHGLHLQIPLSVPADEQLAETLPSPHSALVGVSQATLCVRARDLREAIRAFEGRFTHAAANTAVAAAVTSLNNAIRMCQ